MASLSLTLFLLSFSHFPPSLFFVPFRFLFPSLCSFLFFSILISSSLAIPSFPSLLSFSLFLSLSPSLMNRLLAGVFLIFYSELNEIYKTKAFLVLLNDLGSKLNDYKDSHSGKREFETRLSFLYCPTESHWPHVLIYTTQDTVAVNRLHLL